ncbi:hypothetical protein GA0115259_100445 [Streptomyces sp. MnatMP-M17]|nr:hypothetical protein GA0115259_100445 [Streptomyces sp. MnatMP-M17]
MRETIRVTPGTGRTRDEQGCGRGDEHGTSSRTHSANTTQTARQPDAGQQSVRAPPRNGLRDGTEVPPRRTSPLGHTPRRALCHRWRAKFTAMFSLDWSMVVKPAPITLAVLFWLDAPAPVATCCVVVELPKL